MKKKFVLPADAPAWLTDESKIAEPEFCSAFLEKHPMKCIHGCFFTVDGMVTDETALKQEIYDEISPWLETRVARKVDELLNAIRLKAHADEIPLTFRPSVRRKGPVDLSEADRIHMANGTWYLDGHFTEEKEYCRNRLEVNYNPDAGEPKVWLGFLQDLLEEEDIPTLQEYLGYCLLPTTKAQKMMMLIGRGGEGKSRIGLSCGPSWAPA